MGQTELFPYYERELAALRGEAELFAREHPHAAARLRLSGQESPDPHVERLIESFAFLTGRIQRRLDSDLPVIPTAVLDQIYPQLCAPVPSMAVVEAVLDPIQARPPRAQDLPSGSILHARSAPETGEPAVCRFAAPWPLTLQPLTGGELDVLRPADLGPELDRAATAAAIRLRLRCAGPLDFAKVGPVDLLLHLDVNPTVAGAWYEALVNHVGSVLVRDADGVALGPERPSAQVLTPIGFGEEDAVLPATPRGHDAYRLLLEHWHFPRKFLFFRLRWPQDWGARREVELLFLMPTLPPGELSPGRARLLTNCFPVINLFPQITEPLKVSRERSDYLLEPDTGRGRSTEIHSVLAVTATPSEGGPARPVPAYFSSTYGVGADEPSLFWSARRELAQSAGLRGTRTWLSFTDRDFGPAMPDAPVVFASTLCTNRHLAEQLQPHATLEVEESLPIRALRLLHAPTPQIDPHLHGGALWRLVSSLSLNMLSLADGEASIDALGAILELYGHGALSEARAHARGIAGLTSRHATRRIATPLGHGMVSGLKLTVSLDEESFVGRNPLLFAAVLDRFLALHAAVNSFTQLDLRAAAAASVRNRQGGPWFVFPPRVGARIIL
jgi:type VI secretion system protein ImpG